MTKESQECLEHIRKTHNLESLSIGHILDLAFEWEKPRMLVNFKQEQEYEEKKKKEEAEREDYKEETDEFGKLWYIRSHYYHQRPESRKLKQGDIIQYKRGSYDKRPDSNGIMIVGSFDFESDFVARSYFHMELYYMDKNDLSKIKFTYGGGSCPGINEFSLATEQEIENFFNDIKENAFDQYLFYFKSNIVPDYIKEKYGKYIDGGSITWENKEEYGYDRMGKKL